MEPPLLLYSTNTWLAYTIAERFYGGIHYAWCSPLYDGAMAARHMRIPPSSSPAEIYRNFSEEARRGERHSDALRRNRDGIMTGARLKWEAGLISDRVYAEIGEVVDDAYVHDFSPLLFIMPFEKVEAIASEVPVKERAHPLSIEYRVEALPRQCFDILELRS